MLPDGAEMYPTMWAVMSSHIISLDLPFSQFLCGQEDQDGGTVTFLTTGRPGNLQL